MVICYFSKDKFLFDVIVDGSLNTRDSYIKQSELLGMFDSVMVGRVGRF